MIGFNNPTSFWANCFNSSSNGVMEHVVVDVPHQVDQALLLLALGRVVGGVEVGNQDAVEPVEHVLQDGPFPRRGVDIDDLLHVGEGPDIAGMALDKHLGFVGVDQAPSEFCFIRS